MATSEKQPPRITIKQESGLVIKPQPGTVIKSERLPSFTSPRDLTLGGLGPGRTTRGSSTNKKVYVPNLNAVRNKNTDVKTSRDINSRGRGRIDRGRGERGGRNNRGRGGSSLIQTMGLFSEGAAGQNIRRSYSSEYRSSTSNDSSGGLRKPTLTKKELKIDINYENQAMKDILGDSDEDDVEMSDNIMPVILKDAKTKFNLKVNKDNKSSVDIKIKQEIDDLDVKPQPSELAVKQENNVSHYPETLDEFFSVKQPQLFLLQLPDTLPGRGPDKEPDQNEESERPTSPDPSASYCTIKQLEDGLVGKFVRYKSGKTKLILGESRFNVELGMNPGFLQELMSISTNREERSGNMINLGQIQAKLSASPDWEYMFSKMS